MGEQLTLGEAIRRQCELSPTRAAVLSSDFAPLTYQDLQQQIDSLRRQLREAGLGPQARIGIMLPHGPGAVLALLAVACCAVAVPLDPKLTRSEIDRRLDVLSLDALLQIDDGSESAQAAAVRDLLVIAAMPVGAGRLALNLLVPTRSLPPAGEPHADAPAFILPTSGTTAEPKLIPFSHRNMLAAAARLQTWFGLTPDDRCLSVAAPYYSHGLKVTVFTPLLTGGSIALPHSAAVVDLDEWFGDLRPTWYSAGPTIHAAVFDHAQSQPEATRAHTLQFIVSGGAPLGPKLLNGLQDRLGVPVLEHYGLSEAAQMAANQPPPGPSKPGTCGRPWPGTLAILGEDGRMLLPGERGEIVVRGPTVMPGYLNDPVLNQASFVDGWLRTGDIGSLDEDGFLSLHGRLKDMINRGGEKIAPAEIDQALLLHPAVAAAAAFPVPHPRLGEDVAAAVVLRPGESATADEIRRFLCSQLASFKIPHRIHLLDELPRSGTGKVQRRQLTEHFSSATPHGPVRTAAASAPGPSDLQGELLALWSRLLKVEALTADDNFFEMGGDSVLAVDMLIEIEKMVGQHLPDDLLFGAETVRQLAPLISARLGPRMEPIISFNADGDRPPLFFFHGSFANEGIYYVRRIVSLLGPDQPVAVVVPHGLDGGPIPESVELMANDRLPLVLKRQPVGPYWLAGWCNGSLVAFEVARLLKAAGHKVEMVAMIDPPTISARPIMRAMLSLLQDKVSVSVLVWVFKQMERFEKASRMRLPEVAAHVKAVILKSNPEALRPLRQYQYSAAMARYRPTPLDVPVVFYAADHDGRAWRRLSSDLEVVAVKGGHTGCVTIHARPLVEHLRQRISRSSSTGA